MIKFSLISKAANFNTEIFRHLTFNKVTIPEAAYTQLRRRPTEDEQANARNL